MRRVTLTRMVSRLFGLHRFNCWDQKSPAWQERAEAAVALYERAETAVALYERVEAAAILYDHHLDAEPRKDTPVVIADLGCGNRRLEAVLRARLGRSHEYRGYDLHPQSSITHHVDLERELPPGPVDAAFLLGVVEYLLDVPALLSRLRAFAPVAVLSYVVSDSPVVLSRIERDRLGWRSHYSSEEMVNLLHHAGYEREHHVTVNDGQTMLWLVTRSGTTHRGRWQHDA